MKTELYLAVLYVTQRESPYLQQNLIRLVYAESRDEAKDKVMDWYEINEADAYRFDELDLSTPLY